ncbi:MAG: nitroreductase family protein [Candidatus Sumerlaeota bacterium]
MEFSELVRKRKSVRQFAPTEISDETLLEICEAGRLAPSGCNKQNREFIIIRDRVMLDELGQKVQPGFSNAAAAIAIVMNPEPTRYGSYWIEDASAACQNMLLAIVDAGYDSVWVEGTLLMSEEYFKEKLGIPDEKRLYIMLPIGKAKEKVSGPKKDALEDIVYFEKFGQRK